jgi:DNA repair protein RadA/Sms
VTEQSSPAERSSPADAQFICKSCRTTTHAYAGKCSTCGKWQMMVPLEEAGNLPMPARAIARTSQDKLVPTGIAAVDRVLGGLFPGGVYLLGGNPGCGKSTLALQIAERWRPKHLYISAEESREQISARCERIDTLDVEIFSEGSLDAIVAMIESSPRHLIVVDSLQKLTVQDCAMGGITALKTAVNRLTTVAQLVKSPLILICHVTGEGDFAGPQTVQHDVDCCAMMNPFMGATLLRCPEKNRYWPTGKTGWLQMTAKGLVDAGPELILPPEDLAGSCLCIGEHGLPVEVQVAVNPTELMGTISVGMPEDRAQMIAALLHTPRSSWMVRADGDELARDSGSDLALALAFASAKTGIPLAQRTCAWGELTLDGRVLAPPMSEARREAAEDLGLRPIFAPPSAGTLEHVLRILGLEHALDPGRGATVYDADAEGGEDP